MSLSQRHAALGIVAIFALQFFWYGFLLPPALGSRWLIAGLFALPMLPAMILLLRTHRRAAFWGAVAALFYFSHGVMETWANPPARFLAIVESALSVWLVVSASWDGLSARRTARKRAAADV